MSFELMSFFSLVKSYVIIDECDICHVINCYFYFSIFNGFWQKFVFDFKIFIPIFYPKSSQMEVYIE